MRSVTLWLMGLQGQVCLRSRVALLLVATACVVCYAQPHDEATVARYFAAIAQGDSSAVQSALASGVGLDATNEFGLTGLHVAAYQRKDAVVAKLIEALPGKPSATKQSPTKELGFKE
ncbi:MAG: hypothetical protein AAGA03_00580 [Planctomycetota bacterium]